MVHKLSSISLFFLNRPIWYYALLFLGDKSIESIIHPSATLCIHAFSTWNRSNPCSWKISLPVFLSCFFQGGFKQFFLQFCVREVLQPTQNCRSQKLGVLLHSSALRFATVTPGLKTPVASKVPTNLKPSHISVNKLMSGQFISSANSFIPRTLLPSMTLCTCDGMPECSSFSEAFRAAARLDHFCKNWHRNFVNWWGDAVRLMKSVWIILSGRFRNSSKGCHRRRALSTNCNMLRYIPKTHKNFAGFPLFASDLNRRLPAGMGPCACMRFFLWSTAGTLSMRHVVTSRNSGMSWGTLRPLGCDCGIIRAECSRSNFSSKKLCSTSAYCWHIKMGYSASFAVLKHCCTWSYPQLSWLWGVTSWQNFDKAVTTGQKRC